MKLTSPNFLKPNILIIGDVILDRYFFGCTNRILSEISVPVVNVEKVKEYPGGAANVAMNVATLGANSHLISLLGNDKSGYTLQKKLKTREILCDFVLVPSWKTTTKSRIVSNCHQLIRFDFEEKIKDFDSNLFLEKVRKALLKSNILIISDYDKGSLKFIKNIIFEAKKLNIPIMVDPKGTDFDRYRGVTLIKPNFYEFESVVGVCKNEKIMIAKGMDLIEKYQISALLITQSEKGMILLRSNEKPIHFPAKSKNILDATGAGDTVISTLAFFFSMGKNFKEACFLANTAAGIVVKKLGISTVDLSSLEEEIPLNSARKFGILTKEELMKEVYLSKKRGEKIVMTNGVFDILHIGHVKYLSQAKKLGDRLIVAVNNDEIVRILKGKHRPIHSLTHRMQVLSELKSVDWVVPFNEKTPKNLILEILPDLLVKGGNYRLKQVIGKKEVSKYGGKVKVLNLEKDYSTSNIIEKIGNLYKDIKK